ncbi:MULTISPECIES: APC family permease [Duganella]|jgi:amino acid transporter|uniref:APC family permease n=1 Tax=Duganella TaxID=75654 RepID=UPI0030EA5B01
MNMLEETRLMEVEGLPVQSTELRRGTLGVGLIVLLVISAASPLSVVAGGFPIGIMLGNGAGTPALVILALLLLLAFAAGYTAMAGQVTNAGGFYALIARGLGGHVGGAAAVIAIVGYNTLQFALYGMFGAVTSDSLLAVFGVHVPWWACAFAAMGTIAVFGYRRIDLSAKVLALFVIAEYATVFFLDVSILRAGGDSGITLASFTPSVVKSGNPSIGLLFCFAAFIGFEATTIYGEEAKNPRKNIPLATYISVLLIGCFYAVSLWCMVVGAGPDKVVAIIQALADPTMFLYTLSDRYAGPVLTTILRGLFIMSVYAGLLAFHNATARYFYAMGREGLFPCVLGHTHREHQSPHKASVLQSVLCACVVLLFAVNGADPVLTLFAWLSNLATLCIMLLMSLTSAAVVIFFLRNNDGRLGKMRTLILPVVSGIGLMAILLLAVMNFHVLTGASRFTSYALICVIPLAFVGGLVAARLLCNADAVRFAGLGQDRN